MHDFNNLSELQNFCKKFVKEKGFENETLPELMVLLQEEIGELARGIRHSTGMKVAKNVTHCSLEHIEHELSDCIKYLVIIANKFGINLAQAFQKKHSNDFNREWSSFEATHK